LEQELAVGRLPKTISSGYTSKEVVADVFRSILARMSNGEALTKILKEEDQPDYCVFINWAQSSEDMYKEYARARQIQADYFADQTVEIADSETDNNRARNRMDARRWHASKIAPRKYGDRVVQEHTGEGGGPIAIASLNLKGLNDDELLAMQKMLSKATSKE